MNYVIVEVAFSKIGISENEQPRKIAYIPTVVVQFEGSVKKKKIHLEGFVYKTTSVKRIIKANSFIALSIDDEEFRVYNLDGKLQKSVLAADYGRLIQVEHDYFVLLKDKTATWIDNKGEVASVRELAEEELLRLASSRK